MVTARNSWVFHVNFIQNFLSDAFYFSGGQQNAFTQINADYCSLFLNTGAGITVSFISLLNQTSNSVTKTIYVGDWCLQP